MTIGHDMKVAYFDCFAGAAGDMICGALIEAGASIEYLRSSIAAFEIKELKELSLEKVIRCGISATKFTPVLETHHHHHDHDSDHKHKHEHNHDHNHKHHHHHEHRNLSTIKELIKSNDKLPDKVKADSIAIFELLAQAEAKAHGVDIDSVHFHEVGAVDSITDIVCACLCIDYLGIEKIYSSKLTLGSGHVHCAHGVVCVPAPATLAIIHGIPTQPGLIEKELLTPTAAAILKYYSSSFGAMPQMTISATGYGAGSLDPSEFANATRVVIGEIDDQESYEQDSIDMLECNIDDATGEIIADSVEYLKDISGVLDVSYQAITMKNARAAIKLSIMAATKDSEKIADKILATGLTLGVRKYRAERKKLYREFVKVKTVYGDINVKIGRIGGAEGKIVFLKAEHRDAKEAAKKSQRTTREIAALAESLAIQT